MALAPALFVQLDENFVLIDDANLGGGGGGDHGLLSGLLDDDHTQYALLAGRAGGQSVFGGTASGNDLTLQGSTVNTGGTRINMNSPLVFGPYSGTNAAYGFSYEATETFSAAFIGGGLNFSGNIAGNNGTFIYESFRGAPTITTGAPPGFSAYTVLQSLPRLIGGTVTAHRPYSPLVINAGAVVENATVAVAMTTSLSTGLNWAPQTRASAVFSTMSTTDQIGVAVTPTYSSVANSTVNLGTITGMRFSQPAVSLFQQGDGTNNMTAYLGLDFPNFTFGGASATVEVIRSALNAGTNKLFLNHTGSAESIHNGGLRFQVDLAGVSFGASDDWSMGWAGAGFQFEQQNSGAVEQFQKSFPAAGRMLFDWSNDMELTVNCVNGFSLGAQSGGNGNTFGAFVTSAQTITVAGEYSQFLLTQGGNDTIDAALGLHAAWTLNTSNPTIGTGSLTTHIGLNIGGNPSQGSVDNAGLRILSNPAGGSGVNAALWVTTGLSRFDGRVDINNGIALGGGAAATLGTIGLSGPTAAAQAQWVEIDIGGVPHWIAAWT